MAVVKQRAFWVGLIWLALCAIGCVELARSIYLSEPASFAIMVVLLPTLLAGATSMGFLVKAF